MYVFRYIMFEKRKIFQHLQGFLGDIFYNKIFSFFTPIFLTPKILLFYTTNFTFFIPIFFTPIFFYTNFYTNIFYTNFYTKFLPDLVGYQIK